jgi:hypothetical protein
MTPIRLLPTITEPVYPDGWSPDSPRVRWPWSPRERQVLRERYLSEGGPACLRLLPLRNPNMLHMEAARMGLRKTRGYQRQAPASERDDRLIRAYYGQPSKAYGGLKTLAAQTGRTKGWLLARARQLGLVTGPLKAPDWRPEELAILEEYGHESDTKLQHRLKKAGFKRSTGAIAGRYYRYRIPRDRTDPDCWSANQLAFLLGMDVHRLLRLIQRGLLRAHRQGDFATRLSHQIKRADVRTFLVTYPTEWDHRGCDHLWLIEVLAGTIGGIAYHRAA